MSSTKFCVLSRLHNSFIYFKSPLLRFGRNRIGKLLRSECFLFVAVAVSDLNFCEWTLNILLVKYSLNPAARCYHVGVCSGSRGKTSFMHGNILNSVCPCLPRNRKDFLFAHCSFLCSTMHLFAYPPMRHFVETSLYKVHHEGVFRCIFERWYRFFFALPTFVHKWEKQYLPIHCSVVRIPRFSFRQENSRLEKAVFIQHRCNTSFKVFCECLIWFYRVIEEFLWIDTDRTLHAVTDGYLRMVKW